MKILTTKERIELLHKNHKEHMATIMRSYAEQYHELVEKLEVEMLRDNNLNNKQEVQK